MYTIFSIYRLTKFYLQPILQHGRFFFYFGLFKPTRYFYHPNSSIIFNRLRATDSRFLLLLVSARSLSLSLSPHTSIFNAIANVYKNIAFVKWHCGHTKETNGWGAPFDWYATHLTNNRDLITTVSHYMLESLGSCWRNGFDLKKKTDASISPRFYKCAFAPHAATAYHFVLISVRWLWLCIFPFHHTLPLHGVDAECLQHNERNRTAAAAIHLTTDEIAPNLARFTWFW